MSLNLAIGSAVSSLIAIERQMAIASANISNATVNGYTAKSATLTTQVTDGIGSGVDVASIASNVNQYLLKDIVSATSASSADSTTSDYYTSLQNLLGEISSSTSGNDLSSQINTLATDLQNLETTPDDASLKTQVVNDLDTLASTLQSTANGVQGLRTQADQEIGDKVTEVNTSLDTISSLNQQIARAVANGDPTADLEDQRNTALQTIAGDMDVNYYTDSNDQMHVFTAQNQALVDNTVVNHLSHNVASSISAGVTYGSGIAGIYVAGTDITSQIKSGSIGALIDMRDDTLPNAESELDSLASNLSSALNTVANQGTASPPPSSLTGTTTVAATDAITVASGTTLRVALTDASGAITSYQDIDLSADSTVQDVLDSLNGISGVTASITNGQLTIASSSGGIALSTLSGSVGGTDVSSYFGLNDLVTGGDSAQTFAVNPDLLSNSSLLPSGTLSQAATLTVGDKAVGASDASIATSLYNALAGDHSFAAAGWLGSNSTSFTKYAANLISDIATRASDAGTTSDTSSATLGSLQTSFANQSGVNTDEQTAIISQLQNYYAASAKVISTANAMFTDLLNAVAAT